MRNDLKAVEGVVDVETDLDAMTCQFKIRSDIDFQKLMRELVEKNDKFADWTHQ